MTTTVTRGEVVAAIDELADAIRCIRISDPEADAMLAAFARRLTALAGPRVDSDPDLAGRLLSLAAECADAAEEIAAAI